MKIIRIAVPGPSDLKHVIAAAKKKRQAKRDEAALRERVLDYYAERITQTAKEVQS